MKGVLAFCLVLTTLHCKSSTQVKKNIYSPATSNDSLEVTPEQADAYVDKLDKNLRELWVKQSFAEWEKCTDVSDTTEAKAAAASEKTMRHLTMAINDSMQFNPIMEQLDPDTSRQLQLLRLAGMPAPDDATKAQHLATVTTRMDSLYRKGKFCKSENDCQELEALEKIMNESHDPQQLLKAWKAWHSVGKDIKPLYEKFVSFANEGAQGIGFADIGSMWRSGYDMSPDSFENEVERLWNEVKPLYDELQCYTRNRLEKKYSGKVDFPDRTIPAHLLGNMWAQSWNNIFSDIEPFKGQVSPDITPALVKQNYSPKKMVRLAESFFTSIGMDPLPDTFWQRSIFTKPKDRKVVCQASAWDMTFNDDIRIKMCININQEDLTTIHHELGHSYYFHYYHQLPVLYQSGAHDGFHEAIGDAIALSITPSYLKNVGLLKKVQHNSKALINQQMFLALDKIAFLPWGLLVDKWRWDVFSGKVPPEQYNDHWWFLRKKYQGITPPTQRSDDDFDPGAKYHIPANVPYTRYFLSFVLQFQFHEALCKATGHTGPLHKCSIYGNKVAGAKLIEMLKMGASKPWPDALEAITGSRQMTGTSLVQYFEPLSKWLKEHNSGQTCGWN